MESNTQTIEKAYTTKEIAVMVDIAEPTVRKYAQALEKEGYQFIKEGEGKARTFVEYDAMVLRHFKEIRSKTNITVEKAAEIIAAKHKRVPIQNEALLDIPQNNQYDKRYEDLEGKINKQNEVIEQLVKTINYHQEELEKISDRDKALMQAMREVQETKKLLIESKQKKSFFKKLFGR